MQLQIRMFVCLFPQIPKQRFLLNQNMSTYRISVPSLLTMQASWSLHIVVCTVSLELRGARKAGLAPSINECWPQTGYCSSSLKKKKEHYFDFLFDSPPLIMHGHLYQDHSSGQMMQWALCDPTTPNRTPMFV